MTTIKRKRRLWKTFYFTGQEDKELESLWVGTPSGSHHIMSFESHGVVETNLPYSELRAMFRMIDAKMPDHVTDTIPSWERYADEDGDAL